jgi:soluble lytic murein transglycosylase
MSAFSEQTVIRSRRAVTVVALGLVVAVAAFVGASARGGIQLAPTVHPPLSPTAADMWLVPPETAANTRAAALYQPLTDAAAEMAAGNYDRALTLVNRPSLSGSALADYAAYYKGVAQLRLSRAADARETFDALQRRKPSGYLAVAAPLGEAEAAASLGNHGRALAIYEKLTADKTAVNEQILARQAEAARVVGDRRKTAEALLRIYYEFPLTDAAVAAAAELAPLRDIVVRQGYKLDLGRAVQLYGARRYSDARAAFVALQGEVSGDDRELVELRIAECDFFLQRYQATLDALAPWLDRASRQAEAKFFHLSALRGLGRDEDFLARTEALVRDFPDSSWSEEALNNLGTYYILKNDDGMAAKAFDQLFARFPNGQRADRAAWKSGWWAYKNAEYAGTVRIFEGAAASFPRSDYRPLFLYWSARSHGKLGSGADAESRLRLVVTDYGNSYYGRLAGRHLSRSAQTTLAADAIPAARQAAAAVRPTDPPNAGVIRLLLASDLYDDALNELRFSQRSTGSSAVIEATMAWAYHRKGELRRAITLMRRAYPQHLTADQALPKEILQVIFPLTYWDLIRKHAAARNLDPYLIAALVGQESTFDPAIRSSANAWGLMQIVPATGRQLARSLGIRRFTTSMLTNPETNVRMGTLYFSRLVQQFGGTHYALASYNAGENRVVRWKAERPGLDEDEFIDDIPFPETQNYVKRILGTAEDYRRLYGKGGGRPIPVPGVTAKRAVGE